MHVRPAPPAPYGSLAHVEILPDEHDEATEVVGGDRRASVGTRNPCARPSGAEGRPRPTTRSMAGQSLDRESAEAAPEGAVSWERPTTSRSGPGPAPTPNHTRTCTPRSSRPRDVLSGRPAPVHRSHKAQCDSAAAWSPAGHRVDPRLLVGRGRAESQVLAVPGDTPLHQIPGQSLEIVGLEHVRDVGLRSRGGCLKPVDLDAFLAVRAIGCELADSDARTELLARRVPSDPDQIVDLPEPTHIPSSSQRGCSGGRETPPPLSQLLSAASVVHVVVVRPRVLAACTPLDVRLPATGGPSEKVSTVVSTHGSPRSAYE